MNDKNCEPAQGEAGKPMTKEMVADFMSIAPRTVESWVQQGILPKPTVIGRRAYWHPKAIHTWLNSRLPAPDSQTLDIGGADLALPAPTASPKAKKPGRPRSALPACVTAKPPKSRSTK
jgi:predicted DNA-binding transcriptional regulator AlpA